MNRVFLDANVLFSAAYRPDSGLLKLWKLKVELITSAYALEEAFINLETEAQRDRLKKLMENVQIISAYTDHELPEGITLPDKDLPILQAAIDGNATHILTGDITHFGKYYGKKILGILILPPGDYLRK
jgi:predicted nucleic acid-binding protein